MLGILADVPEQKGLKPIIAPPVSLLRYDYDRDSKTISLYLDENFRYAEEFFKEMLPEAVFSEREATYLAWVDLGAYFGPREDLPLFFANNAGVILEGADSFVRNGTGFVRLNLAIPRSVLEEGLRRITAAVKNR